MHGETSSGSFEYKCHQICGQAQRDWAYPLLVKRDLFGETLLGEVAHSVVVSIRQEMRQLVLALGILLQHTPGLKPALMVCTHAGSVVKTIVVRPFNKMNFACGSFTAVQCPLFQLFQLLL